MPPSNADREDTSALFLRRSLQRGRHRTEDIRQFAADRIVLLAQEPGRSRHVFHEARVILGNDLTPAAGELLARFCADAGHFYRDRMQATEALDFYEASDEAASRGGCEEIRRDVHLSRAALMEMQGNFDAAHASYGKLIDRPDQEWSIRAEVRRAVIALKSGETDRALSALRRQRVLAGQADMRSASVAFLEHKLGIAEASAGELDIAVDLQEGLQQGARKESLFYVQCTIALGDIYFRAGEPDRGLKYLSDAESVTTARGFRHQAQSLRLLFDRHCR